MSDKTLEALRQEIDSVDAKLIQTLAERFELVEQVGDYKKKHNIPPLDQNRWDQVIESRKKLAEEKKLPVSLIETLFTTIHKHALEIEK